MHKQMPAADIAALKEKGAEVKPVPRLVEGSFDTPALVEAMTSLAAQQRKESAAQNKALQNSINNLAKAIASREFPSTDMGELTAAVSGLKQEATVLHDHTDYRLDFERDQRGFMKTGVMFVAVPKRLNS